MVRGAGDDVIARAKRGDEAAWAELYGDHATHLVRWLSYLDHPGAATDVEGVAAEAWFTAARQVADFSGDRREFGGWLFGIARDISLHR
jgi:RNA polymerase sigma-70 factor (ECF subfamily)